uniref:Uncharacterized protein n=1 Tax=Solanum tuberosum TaxID=4113 RepID=M1C9H4_SOLTU
MDRLPRSGITNLDRLTCSGITNLDRLTCSGITNLDRLTCSGITNLDRLTCSGITNLDRLTCSGITNLDRLTCSGITNLDRLTCSGITNLDRLTHFSIIMGSVATFRHNYWIGYHVPSVDPVNVPAEESAARSRGRDIDKNVGVENVEDVGQEEEVQAETTDVPPIDLVLARQIMSFLKGLVGPGVLPSVQATQAPANPHVASTAPKTGGMGGNDAFFHPLLDSVMTDQEQAERIRKGRIKFLGFQACFEVGDGCDSMIV